MVENACQKWVFETQSIAMLSKLFHSSQSLFCKSKKFWMCRFSADVKWHCEIRVILLPIEKAEPHHFLPIETYGAHIWHEPTKSKPVSWQINLSQLDFVTQWIINIAEPLNSQNLDRIKHLKWILVAPQSKQLKMIPRWNQNSLKNGHESFFQKKN